MTATRKRIRKPEFSSRFVMGSSKKSANNRVDSMNKDMQGRREFMRDYRDQTSRDGLVRKS